MHAYARTCERSTPPCRALACPGWENHGWWPIGKAGLPGSQVSDLPETLIWGGGFLPDPTQGPPNTQSLIIFPSTLGKEAGGRGLI